MRHVSGGRWTRRVLAPLAVVGVLGAGRALLAGGTIDTTSAQIAVGAAPAAGTVVVDANPAPAAAPLAPSLGTLGTLGTMPGALPAFPGAGPGGMPVHITSSGVAIPGGTYDYDSLVIDPLTVLAFSGPVTLRVKGDVTLNGTIATGDDGASVTILCGGDFTMTAGVGTPQTGISTGRSAPIKIDVAGRFTADAAPGTGAYSQISTFGSGSDVEVIARGGAGAATMTFGSVGIGGAAVAVRSATGLSVTRGYVLSASAAFQAFGGDLSVDHTEIGSNAGPVVVHASGSVTSSDTGLFHSDGGDCEVVGFGGDVSLESGYLQAFGGGNGRVRAKHGVSMKDGEAMVVGDGAGAMEVTAFGGDVAFEPDIGPGAVSNLDHEGTGPILISASGGVRFTGQTAARATSNDVVIRAFGGDVEFALSGFGVAGRFVRFMNRDPFVHGARSMNQFMG